MSQKIKKNIVKGHLRGILDENTTVNDEARTVELIWSTGFKGMRSGWDGNYLEELSMKPEHVDMSRLTSGAPLLDSHKSWELKDVIGVVERAWLENGVGKAVVRFSSDPEADKIFQKVKEKVLRNVSIGYQVRKYEDVTQKGENVPTFRATSWMPMEISIVPVGFDPHAQVRSQQEETFEVEIESTVEAEPQETKPEDSNTSLNEPTAQPNPEPEAQRNQTMTDAEKKALEAAKAAEKQRQLEIRQAVRKAKLDEKFADELCNEDITVEQAAIRILDKVTSTQETIQTSVRVEVSGDNQSKRRENLEEAMLHRIDSKNFKMTDGAREFHGKSLLRAIETIVPRYSMESDSQYAKRAMASSDLPQALANVAEKGLQKAYELQPRTSSLWTRSDTLRNYKQFSQVKAGDFGNLAERAEGANFAEATFTDEQEVVTLKDYGIIHAFSSQMLVNDDLGVIARLATQGGVAASRLENKLAYDALKTNKTMSDGVALYDATHGNLGTAGAIEEASVSEAYKLMRKQSSVDGRDKLNLTPKYFVCGPDQEVAARKFFASIMPNETSNVNIWSGSMQIIVDAELTGNQYYFLADPSVIDTVVLYRLAGQESPQVESRIKFENNNLELKVAHACAAEPMDWRGIVKNAGQV